MTPVPNGLGGSSGRFAWLKAVGDTLLLLAVFALFQVALLFMGDEA